MGMNFTNEQREIVYDDRGINVLVSAAAGSGKTTVLVERIKQLIINEGFSVDNMLIVTFTELAAKEMKERIVKAINDEIVNTNDEALIKRLQNELNLIPNANISTFHSFALEVIKKFYYLIQIEPNLKIIDDAQGEILLSESMDELFEKYFDSKDERFFDFLNKYTGEKSNKNLRDMISFTYEKIMSMPNPYDWLNDFVEVSGYTKEAFLESSFFKNFVLEATSKISGYISVFDEKIEWAKANNLSALEDYLVTDKVPLVIVNEYLKTGQFDEIFKYEIPSKKRIGKSVKEVKAGVYLADLISEVRDDAFDYIKHIKNDIFFDYFDNLIKDLNGTYSSLLFFKELMEEYNKIFSQKKEKKGYITFNDMEHLAFNILCCEDASSYYKKKFKHIFIDEFQDTNGIQFAIVDKITNKSNLFMVGDVKQSIYRFRQADPSLFKGRYEKYKDEEDKLKEKTTSKKVDLNANFRSKEKVVNFINYIFENIMEDYDDNAKLYGKSTYLNEEPQDVKLYLIENDKAVDSSSEGEEDILAELNKAEKEALATVKIINKYKSSEYGFKNKDIVILLRSVKNFADIYYNTLLENGIFSFIDDNDGYFDTIEINTFCSMLNVIDNEMQDVDLLTVMRSEMFNFKVKELVDIRLAINNNGPFYNCILEYSENGNNEELKNKCINFLDTLRYYRELSYLLPLEELVWKIMTETNFYISMGALPMGERRQANLRVLVDKASFYRKNYNGLLFGFVKYIESVKEKKVSMGQVKIVSEEDDVVKIMTIHKSKGLEFPVVILPGYNDQRNYREGAPNLVLDKNIGIALNYVDYDKNFKRNTILRNIISDANKNEAYSEEKRVLYVAMTRAKEVLALIGTVKNVDDKLKESFGKPTTYLTMTGREIFKREDEFVHIMTVDDFSNLNNEVVEESSEIFKVFSSKASEVSDEIAKLMEYNYSFEDELKTKSKYGVSELNSNDFSPNIFLNVPIKTKEEKKFSPSEIGTINHKVLANMDLSETIFKGEEYLKGLLLEMVSNEQLEESEIEAVNIKNLLLFANSDIGKRMAKSCKVYREQSFNIKWPVDGVDTLVQGIIDCFFYEDDGVVLLDYKTTRKTNEEEIKDEYKKQIEIYKSAIEKAKHVKVKEAYLYLTNFGKVIKMGD